MNDDLNNEEYFNFLLNNEDDTDSDNENICLITHEKLDMNYIELTCKHKFNYYSICKEIINQRKGNIYNKNNLDKKKIICPYCRNIQKNNIPYIPCQGIKSYKNINNCLENKLEFIWVYKSGKNKNNTCKKNGFNSLHGIYCKNHHNIIEKKIQ